MLALPVDCPPQALPPLRAGGHWEAADGHALALPSALRWHPAQPALLYRNVADQPRGLARFLPWNVSPGRLRPFGQRMRRVDQDASAADGTTPPSKANQTGCAATDDAGRAHRQAE